MNQDKEIKFLEDKARHIRRLIIRMLVKAGSGHPGEPFLRGYNHRFVF